MQGQLEEMASALTPQMECGSQVDSGLPRVSLYICRKPDDKYIRGIP